MRQLGVSSRLRLIVSCLLALGFLFGSPPMLARADAGRPQARVLAANAQVLDVEIALAGEDTPQGFLVALPWYGLPRVEIVESDERVVAGRALNDEADTYPTDIVDLQPLGYLRDLRLGRLRVAPLYRSSDGRWHRVTRVRVRLRFPTSSEGEATSPLPDSIRRLLARALLNPQYPRQWQRPRRLAEPVPPPDNPPAHKRGALRVIVTRPGIQVISREDLAKAGWNVDTIDPRQIHLWLNGQEIALWITGQQDGRLDPGDELRFYAPPFRSPYAKEQIWWLTVEETPGLRWGAVPTGKPISPAIETAWTVQDTEFERVYDSTVKDIHNGHWFWYDLRFLDFPPFPVLDFPFWVEAPSDTSQAIVTLSLYAYKGEQHDLAFALNALPAGELHDTWTGRRDVRFSLPTSSLRDGMNTLTIRGTDAGAHPDGVYVDRISVRYLRRLVATNGVLTFAGEEGDHTYLVEGLPPGYAAVLDVTDPQRPVLIYGTWQYEDGPPAAHRLRFRATGRAGVMYHVQSLITWQHPRVEADSPSDWHNPAQGADVIIISPARWHDLLRPWVEWRQQQGYTVALVDLQDVYDEFSYGQVDPEAIRRFLRHAYATWPDPAPQYVLLVGDGSYDFKDNLGFHPENVLPPYLAEVDPWLGETASDLKYVEVSGNDDIPDMFIGRWPVGNRDELRVVVEKTLFYERNMSPAEWQRHIAFVADNYRDAHGRPDQGGNFPAMAEQTASGQLHRPFISDRLYYAPWSEDQYGPGYIASAEEMRTSVHLLWNRGAGIINWVGHASYEQWGEEKFLHARELADIQNGDRLPFLFSITCFTGYFHHPEYPSLDEALLTKPDGGTVASWSPTGLAVAYGHQYLQEGFYDALIGGERQLGPLTLAGHLRLLAEARPYSFLPQTFLLLGDPVLSLRLGPVNSLQFIPDIIVP